MMTMMMMPAKVMGMLRLAMQSLAAIDKDGEHDKDGVIPVLRKPIMVHAVPILARRIK